MREAVKMYHLFLPRKWFVWIVYILYPAAVGLLGMWCFKIGAVAGIVVSIMLATAFVVCAEYILDVFMFAGIATSGSRSLEYMKTSARGEPLFLIALYGDGIRRLLTTIVSYGLLYAVTRYSFANESAFIAVANGGDGIDCPKGIVFVQCAVFALFFSELGMMFTRKTANALLNLIVLYVMAGLAAGCAMASMEFASVITIAISTVIYIVVWFGSRRFLVQKVRKSYYDEGYKELFQTV